MAVIATEDFSGAADTTLNGKTTTTGGLTWTGSGQFTADQNGLKLTGSGAGKNSSTNGCLIHVPTGSANHYAQAAFMDVSATSKGIAVAVCCVDYQNLIYLGKHFSAGQLRLYKRVGSTSDVTVATITGLTIVAGDVFRLERNGTTVTCFQNGSPIGTGGGYTVSDAVFTGVANAGIFAKQNIATALVDDVEVGNFSVGASLGVTTQPDTYAVVQRDPGATSKALTLGGAYTGTDPTDIQWRLENEAGTLISGYDWTTISGASIASGAWSGVVTVPQDTARGGYIIQLRSRDSGGAEMATVQTAAFTVGVIVECDGQSNIYNQFSGTGAGIGDKCAFFNGTSWTRTNTAIFSTAVATLSDQLGLPVGFFHTAISGSPIRSHTPAHTSTDGAIAEGSDWPTTVSRIADVGGDIELSLWYQGEADTSGTTSQQYQDALNARIAGIRTLTGRSGDLEYRHGAVIIGRNESGDGSSDAGWQMVREALAAVSSTEPGAFVIADAVTYATSGVHLTDPGYIEMAYAEGRSLAWAAGSGSYNARGPIISGATISGSTVTVAFSLNGSSALTGSGTLTGWEFYNGSTWADATDAARVGNTVTFTGVGATQVRYLYGENPDVSNVVRGDVKAATASATTLPAEPTRAAIAVTAGATVLTPSLLTHTKTIYTPAVTVGAVSVAPSLLTRAKTLYAPIVAQGGVTLSPTLLTRTKVIYAPSVSVGSVSLSPTLLTRSKTLYAPVVSQAGAPQIIAPGLLTRAKVVYSPVVVPGEVTLSPSLLTRVKVLYTPTLSTDYRITAPLLTRGKTLYAPTITVGGVTLTPPLLTRGKTIYFPTLTGGDTPVATGGLFWPTIRRRRR